MKITVYGRGNVGGGLADLWERTGHRVARLGRDGGDVSGAEAVLLAIPGGAVGEALGKLRGLEGKVVIDATNRLGVEPPPGFASNAEFVKARSNGPTAKAFSLNYARLYGQVGQTRARPCNLWCGDDAAAEIVERLTRDAGYDPIRIGGLEMAGLQEAMMRAMTAVKDELGLFFYRAAAPDEF